VTVDQGSDTLESVSVAATEIRFRRRGDGPSLVVLHHSFGIPHWLPLYADLATDHDLVVPDLPGFGESQVPTWARHPRDLALLLGHFVDRLDRGPVAVMGCGFGGWVAAELATMAPDRVSHLVLVGSAGLLPEEGRIFDQMLTSHSEYVKSAFSSLAAYEAIYGSDFPLSDDVLLTWAINREMVTRVAWKPYMYNRQMAPLLTEVDVPTLIVWGGEDQIVPIECGEQFERLLANARLEVIPGCGHAVDMEQPERLAALVRAHLAP
jgi:pimeloyl-ACP methyl ester carboxylesterase